MEQQANITRKIRSVTKKEPKGQGAEKGEHAACAGGVRGAVGKRGRNFSPGERKVAAGEAQGRGKTPSLSPLRERDFFPEAGPRGGSRRALRHFGIDSVPSP